MAEHVSTRVNSARLADYKGQTVRLTCKTIKGESAIVEASDGGQVSVKLHRDAHMTDTYVEVIGTVLDESTVKMMACINLGSDLDMQLVNDVVELTFDPRFSKMFR
ncbi:hypothetical protein PLICRDRAFT_701850 [Plicaturopsis crispa FD-325 SS-3]|uniref:Replication factor A protein 3 n=1 Tax=Plicaturopsis crispa FD-325 SS-3 TaxID=944288 RepID=A0A0C9SR28_PLICR|nr:hypothetical protein PLICRDRAFT_701850 [Plicaturopsis crispa FD-325 SS-3]